MESRNRSNLLFSLGAKGSLFSLVSLISCFSLSCWKTYIFTCEYTLTAHIRMDHESSNVLGVAQHGGGDID